MMATMLDRIGRRLRCSGRTYRRSVLIAVALFGSLDAAQAFDVEQATIPFDAYAPRITPGPVAARTVQCLLRRGTNIDPSRQQREDEIVYEGQYPLTLNLPAINLPQVAGVGTAMPAAMPPAGYRLATDRNGLFKDYAMDRFDRVADYWPKHVELGKQIMGAAFQFIILEEIPGKPGAMSIFISRAADAVTIDTGWIFRGECTLATKR